MFVSLVKFGQNKNIAISTVIILLFSANPA